MDPFAVDQKIQGSTYNAASSAPTQAQHALSLGGFAYSFEELLQRVGARLDHAFSAADQSSGLLTASPDAAPTEPVDDTASAGANTDRNDGADHDGGDDIAARGNDAAYDDAPTESSSGNGGGTTEMADNSSNGQNADSGQSASRDDSGSQNGSGNDETTAKSSGEDSSNDQANAKDGDSQNNTTANGANEGANAAVAQQANVGHATAVYATGILANQTNANTTNTQAQTTQQTTGDADTDPALLAQVASQASKTAKGPQRTDNHNNGANQSNNAAAQAKAAAVVDGAPKDALQNQARQLSQAIGEGNRAQINVNVQSEAAQVTSKPTLNAANASILTPNGNASSQSNTQQQANNQQQQSGQNQQQLQAAMAQNQAAQQANAQAAKAAAGGAQAVSGSGLTGAQGAGSAAQSHGGPEGLPNGAQSANAGQGSQQTQQTREAQPQQQAQQAQRQAPQGGSITDQISVKITKAIQSGTDRISIQLKPAELGRVDVRMEMTHDGRVMTVVTAEKQDTLDLLRRDSSELRQALADAGLNSGDMEFNLKGQEQQTADADQDAQGGSSENAAAEEDGAAEDPSGEDGVVSAWESGIFMDGRVDMRA